MDQLVEETIVSVHPLTITASVATTALRQTMERHDVPAMIAELTRIVTHPGWREQRPELIRGLAERNWSNEMTDQAALMCAEIEVLAFEAIAARWKPEQCRVMVVRIDGTPRLSLVCALEGFSA